ncbi:MAG: prolipoprotein diacylglyceryl transferase family protein [Actinomycetota bacterium]
MFASIPYRTFPILHLGPIPIRVFGVFVALGILLGSWLFLRFARERDLDADALTSLAWRVVVLGIIGSRVLFVLTHLSEFTDRPLSVFALWEGGLQFSGAFLVSIVVIVWWQRSRPEVNGLVLTDGIVLGLVPGLMIGRIGCYAVGEHFGKATDFFLGVKYLGGETREGPIAVGTVIHNTSLYEFLLLAPLAGVLFWMARREATVGAMTTTFLLWYGIQRFLTDFLRAYDERVAGLTGAQYISLGMIVAGVVLAWRVRRREGREVASGGEVASPEPEPA